MRVVVSFVVPVHRISFVRSEIGRHVVPLARFADLDRLGSRSFLGRRHAFEFADVVDQLHIVYVALVAPSGVRLDVAATIPVVLVGECERFMGLGGRPVLVLPGSEFVPSGNEYDLRVEFESAAPLFLKIPSVQVTVHARVESFLHRKTAAEGFGRVERVSMSSVLGGSVLRDSDGNQFEFAVGSLHVTVLRIVFEPSPLVVAARAVHVVGLPGPEREKFGDFTIRGSVQQRFGISHDTGFSLPHEPQVFVAFPLINIVV